MCVCVLVCGCLSKPHATRMAKDCLMESSTQEEALSDLVNISPDRRHYSFEVPLPLLDRSAANRRGPLDLNSSNYNLSGKEPGNKQNNIHTYIYMVNSIGFQTFFIQAFKIVVDS